MILRCGTFLVGCVRTTSAEAMQVKVGDPRIPEKNYESRLSQ